MMNEVQKLNTSEELHRLMKKLESHDNAVGIATDYRLDDQGFAVPVTVGLKIFSSPYCAD
jgi:hypothetical protein